jgi:hypothetical protein
MSSDIPLSLSLPLSCQHARVSKQALAKSCSSDQRLNLQDSSRDRAGVRLRLQSHFPSTKAYRSTRVSPWLRYAVGYTKLACSPNASSLPQHTQVTLPVDETSFALHDLVYGSNSTDIPPCAFEGIDLSTMSVRSQSVAAAGLCTGWRSGIKGWALTADLDLSGQHEQSDFD